MCGSQQLLFFISRRRFDITVGNKYLFGGNFFPRTVASLSSSSSAWNILLFLKLSNRKVDCDFQQQNECTVCAVRIQNSGQFFFKKKGSVECMSLLSLALHARTHTPTIRLKTTFVHAPQPRASNETYRIYGLQCSHCSVMNAQCAFLLTYQWCHTFMRCDTIRCRIFFSLLLFLSFPLSQHFRLFFIYVAYAYQIGKTTTTKSTTTSKINTKLKWADRCPSRGKQHWI